MQLDPFEQELAATFSLADRDAKRLLRVIVDLKSVCGMEEREIFDFLRFGAEEEFAHLKESYQWESFRIKIQKKLKPRG